VIENIRKDEIKDFCNSNALCARITDIKFNLQHTKSDIDQILKLNPPTSKDRQSKYKALGLQYADDEKNYYECVETTRYFDADKKIAVIEKRPFKEFGHWNLLGEKLSYLFKPLDKLGIKLYRTRILINAILHIPNWTKISIFLLTGMLIYLMLDLLISFTTEE